MDNKNQEFEILFQKVIDARNVEFALCELLYNQQGNPIDYRFLKVNTTFQEQTGLKENAIVGKTVREIYPDIEQAWIDKYASVVVNNTPIEFTEYNHNTNKHYHVHAFSPSTNKFVMVFEDVSTKVKAEEKLKKVEQDYEQFFNSTTDVFQIIELIYDEQGNAIDYYYIQVNPAFEELVQMKKSELVGKRAKDIFGIVEDYWIQTYERVDKTGIPENFENYGAELDKYYSIKAWKIDNKQVAIAFNDITERKQAEIELIEAKEKAEGNQANITAIIEGNNNNSIWAFNRNYDILYINQVMQQEFLLNFGVLLKPGVNLLEALPEVLHPIWKPRYERVLANEQFTLEDAVPSEKGTVFIEVTFNPIVKNGQVVGGSCFGSNITSRKHEEIELIRAKEKAEESDRLKSAFLANMSHEIRTPMNGILGFTDLLKEPKLTGEEKQDFIRIIESSGNRLLNTVNDLIDFSKIEAGQMQVSVYNVNINDLVEQLFTFFRVEAEKKKLQFCLDISSLTKNTQLLSDQEKIYSILTNLIKNAIKYTQRGRIEFGCAIKGKDLQFFVKDTGYGIVKKRLDVIFDRFIRGGKEEEIIEGAGLGLSISKAYAEMLGGKLWVESEVGVGSQFYFSIPYHIAKTTIAENKDERTASKSQVKGLKILIAEDDPTADALLSILIKENSKEIIHAENGIQAVGLCRSNPDIDLILMDINMPKMNGYEASKEIREFNKEVIIIAQTAYALVGDDKKAIEAGCNDYITKPINKLELFTLIQKYFK